MEAAEEGEEGIFFINVLAKEVEEKEQDGEQEEAESVQDCACNDKPVQQRTKKKAA
jgi:hypothetical protein